MEAGQAVQNALLQATALNLAATMVGAFDDTGVRAVLGLPACEDPLCLIALGRPT
jgi:nitroreductase